MKNHFLVTTSNDIDNLFGVQFITSFFKQLSEHRLTLLHINRLDTNVMEKTPGEMWCSPNNVEKTRENQATQRSFNKVFTLLEQNTMSIEQMTTKTVAERYGKVKDILAEGTKGLYDAIIPGRRASYALQWVFERPGDKTAQTKWGLSIPGTIIAKLKKESYAAVAVGLHGQGKNILKNFNLAGGTTSKLINQIENTSLWCCP